MSTYRELIYMVSDEIKSISDDSIITEEHIKFLLQRHRAYLMYQKYKDIKKEVPESAYQNICLNLESVSSFDGEPCISNSYLRSVEEVPATLNIGNMQVYPYSDFYSGNITFVSKERMRYVGYNKYLRNIIYCSLSADNHIYFKSENPQFMYLEKVNFSAVFENPEDAAKLSCEESSENCDILDKEFPIEETLIPMLIESVTKELLGVNYRPEDTSNNANDDLSTIATFLRNNVKSALQKQIES